MAVILGLNIGFLYTSRQCVSQGEKIIYQNRLEAGRDVMIAAQPGWLFYMVERDLK